MNILKIFTTLSIAALIGLAVAGGALAFSYGLFAPVSGKQAAAAAVAQTGGYAEEVEFEYDYHTGGRYEIDVLAGGRKHKVWVDASDGKVLGMQTKHKHPEENCRRDTPPPPQPAGSA